MHSDVKLHEELSNPHCIVFVAADNLQKFVLVNNNNNLQKFISKQQQKQQQQQSSHLVGHHRQPIKTCETNVRTTHALMLLNTGDFQLFIDD